MIFRDTRCYQCQSCALEVLRFNVVTHVFNDIHRYNHLLLFLSSLALYPRVIERLLSSVSHVSLSLKEIRYEIFRIIADLLPHIRREIVASMQYIVQYLVVVFPSEGWSTAQHDEHYYTHGPVVTLSCVAAFQHFWSYIVRCTIRCSH